MFVYRHIDSGTRRSNLGFDYFLSNKATTWHTAKVACHILGMNLARIDSRGENNWIRGAFKESNAWFGLNDIRREGHFVNADGCIRIFEAWKKGEPNRISNVDCGQLSTRGSWETTNCERKFRFLCKKSDKKLRTPCGGIVLSK